MNQIKINTYSIDFDVIIISIIIIIILISNHTMQRT